MELNINQSSSTAKFAKAVSFAVEKHGSQKRKSTAWPYVVHLYEVAQILQENNCDYNTVIAGILHDTVEDTKTTLEELSQNFGKDIADIVDVLSENKKLPYLERKLLQAERIKNASREAKMVKCADCLSNIKSIYFDLNRGENIWARFNSTRDNIQKHYRSTIEAIGELEDLEMYQKLIEYYQQVFDEKILQNTPNILKSKKMLKFVEDLETINKAQFTCDAKDVLEVLEKMDTKTKSKKDLEFEKLLLSHCQSPKQNIDSDEIEIG